MTSVSRSQAEVGADWRDFETSQPTGENVRGRFAGGGVAECKSQICTLLLLKIAS